jgi:hypothetical protein
VIDGNLPANPQSEFYFDAHGFDGVEMTEFLDGAICRSDYFAVEDVETLAVVMGFTSYNPDNGPGLEQCEW